MSGTNALSGFQYENFGRYGFESYPKGKFLTFALNPYNGLVVLGYNRSAVALEVAQDVISFINDRQDVIADALGTSRSFGDFIRECDGDLVIDRFDDCPFCGCEPRYSDGAIECCGGMMSLSGFPSKLDAVKYWNSRSRRP